MPMPPRDIPALLDRIRKGDSRACEQVRTFDSDELLEHGLADACLSHFGLDGERQELPSTGALHKRARVAALAQQVRGSSSASIVVSPDPFLLALQSATSRISVGSWDATVVSKRLVPLLRSLSNTEERLFWGEKTTWDLVLGRTLSIVQHCILQGQRAAKRVFVTAGDALVPTLAAFALHHEFAQPELQTLTLQHASTILMEYCDIGFGNAAACPDLDGMITLATICALPVPQKRSTFVQEVLPLARRCMLEPTFGGARMLDHLSFIFCVLVAHGAEAASPLTREHATLSATLAEMGSAPAAKVELSMAVEVLHMMLAMVSRPDGSEHAKGSLQVHDRHMASLISAV